MPSITQERLGATGIIRINHSEKSNALSLEMILALCDTFTNLDSQPETRAIIITSAGEDAFCAGLDPAELLVTNDGRASVISERFNVLCSQIESCRVPVIAVINGIAKGRGCELALACHLKIASPNAEFSFSENGTGFVHTDDHGQRLAREIGNDRALEILLSGRAVSAQEALQLGLINRVVAAADLLTQAESLADEIAQLAPLAIRACLEAVIQGTQLPLAEGLNLESQLFATLFATEDVKEGTRAFLEKRPPVFKGQ